MPAARWDNAKKIVEVDLRQKGTELHAATVVGDTVGDPFKDTSSVAMNPVIKFTTLFGLLATEIAVTMKDAKHQDGHWRVLLCHRAYLRLSLVLLHAHPRRKGRRIKFQAGDMTAGGVLKSGQTPKGGSFLGAVELLGDQPSRPRQDRFRPNYLCDLPARAWRRDRRPIWAQDLHHVGNRGEPIDWHVWTLRDRG